MATSEFRQRPEVRLQAFRKWATSEEFSGCRYVQFSGTDCLGVSDVPLPLVEQELQHLLAIGLSVDWAVHEGMLYLRAWQEDSPPDWQYVLADEDVHLVNGDDEEWEPEEEENDS